MQNSMNEASVISKGSLVKILLENHKEMLPLWYCQIKCFEIPVGFPAKMVSYEHDRDSYNDPDNKIAFAAICEAMGSNEAMSRAWWTIKLERTEHEWREWWERRHSITA